MTILSSSSKSGFDMGHANINAYPNNLSYVRNWPTLSLMTVVNGKYAHSVSLNGNGSLFLNTALKLVLNINNWSLSPSPASKFDPTKSEPIEIKKIELGSNKSIQREIDLATRQLARTQDMLNYSRPKICKNVCMILYDFHNFNVYYRFI